MSKINSFFKSAADLFMFRRNPSRNEFALASLILFVAVIYCIPSPIFTLLSVVVGSWNIGSWANRKTREFYDRKFGE